MSKLSVVDRTKHLHVLGVAGSLRRGSYNRALLREACELAPEGVEIEPYDLAGIPFYDGDVEDQGDPDAVARFKERIRAADALLIVTPEYNGGIPGVLKNALDWASRPPGESPIEGKPAVVLGASPSPGGTAGAQEQLVRVLERSRAVPLEHPPVRIARAHEKFGDDDATGSGPRLVDDDARAAVRSALAGLVAGHDALPRAA